MQEIEKYLKFLNELKDIKPVEVKEPTFLDVARFPRYENVISNILAFLFDTRTHGFSDLWLTSLLQCYIEVSNDDIEINNVCINDIEREVSTADSKRIDLLIETDKYLIVIENKVSAWPYNPFDSYHNFAEKYVKDSSNDLKIIEILLSVNCEGDKLSNKYSFYNITYDMLIHNVKKNIGNYLIDANDKWLVYTKDFLVCIENLKDGVGMVVNKEWNKFLEENNDEIASFFDNYFEDLNRKKKLIDNLTNEIENLDKSLKTGSYNTTYNRISRESSYASNYVDINFDNNVFAVESYIMKRPTNEKYENGNFLYVALWNRNNKSYNYDYLIDKIRNNLKLNPEEINSPGWGKYYIIKKINLSDDFTITDISSLIVNIAHLIS